MNEFDKLDSASSSYRESGDCVVKAIALCLGTSYEDAHNLAAEYGRKPHKGLTKEKYISAMESRGAKFQNLFTRKRITKNGRRAYGEAIILDNRCRNIVTCNDLWRLPQEGTFLIRSSGHVSIYQNGIHKDWSADKKNRIIDIYFVDNSNVTKNESAQIKSYIPKKRTRQTSYCWKLIRLDTGETLRRFKRKPTSQIRAIRMGGYIPSLGENVKIDIVRI